MRSKRIVGSPPNHWMDTSSWPAFCSNRNSIGCADSLAPDDDYAKTRAEAKEAFEQRDRYMETASTIVAHRRALALLDELMPSKENAA
ncbi:hypothetical protein [Streptomyces anthocyanicus]